MRICTSGSSRNLISSNSWSRCISRTRFGNPSPRPKPDRHLEQKIRETHFHNSETTEIFFQEQSSDTVPSFLFDTELSDETIGRALSSPLFIQEREETAGRRQAYHSLEESLLPSQSLSVRHVRTERLVNEFSSLGSSSREKPSCDSKKKQIRILFERQKEQILADCRAEIQKHEFQADNDRRSIQKLNGIIESQRSEMNHACAGDDSKTGRYVKLTIKVSMK